MTSEVIYQGNLRTDCKHLRSGNIIITDAPLDNNGKGEAFSPTDLMATSLAACILTIMGIKANEMGLDISGITSRVEKVMASNPRRVEAIRINFNMENLSLSEKERTILIRSASACPVSRSLHPELKQEITFEY